MPNSGFKINIDDLHQSGSTLQQFSGKVSTGGSKLESVGSNVVSHAQGDRSGIGSVIAKALDKGTEVAGKVFSEGGRVIGAAGDRLHSNADNHSANEDHITTSIRGIHGNDKPLRTPKPGEEESGGGSGSSSGNKNGGNKDGDGIRGQGDNPRSPNNLTCEKDPVDVSTGQVVLSETDAEFLGDLPMEFVRTHFSGYRTGRWFGTNWVSTLDQRVEVDETGVSFAAADGTLQRFPLPSVDSWVASDNGPQRRLTRTDDGGYLIDDLTAGRALYFAPGGRTCPLTTLTDRNGNRITFDHDADGMPVRVWHTGGYTVRVETTNRLVTALHSVAADGGEVELMRYGYTGGRLVQVINSSGQALRFEYDPAGRLARWVDRRGDWYRYTYDENGRCVRTEGSGGFLSGVMEYDTENRITYSVDSLGHRKAFHMNAAGQVVRDVDQLGNAATFEWDQHDRLLSHTDELGRRTGYEYTETGNIAAITAPDGSRQRIERNAWGQPVTLVESDGGTWRWEYDERGNVTRAIDALGAVTSWTYTERGHLASATDAVGNTLRLETDASGLTVAEVNALGAVTRYERDQFGRITAVTDAAGGTERFGYTVDGQLAWRRHADGSVQRWVYDGEGNERAHTDQAGAVTRTEVTHLDLLAAEIRPDGTVLKFGYDTEARLVAVTNEQGLVWRYDYDPVGNLVRETDFNGVTADYRYDAAGQLVERTTAAGTTTFDYDLLGNMTERRSPGATVRYAYGPTGYLVAVSDGESRIAYQRDALGRVVAEAVNGRTVHSAYDALGRRVRRRTPSGAETAWEFDGADQPTAVRAAGRTLRFEYDGAGREVRRSFGVGAAVGAVIDQAWTARDQLAEQTIIGAGGHVSQRRSYEYRPDGLPSGVTDQLTGPRTFTHDRLGRVTGVQARRWTERYAYDAAGNVTDAAWPAETDQDAQGERSYAGTVIRAAGRTRFTHDEHGRLVTRGPATPAAGPSAVGTWHYLWDQDNRLVGVRTPEGAHWRYRYDALGRRIAKERLGQDGAGVVELVEFVWDDQQLAEETTHTADGPRVTVWDYEPGSFRPLLQHQRLARAAQDWVDGQCHAMVTDPIGLPTELVDDQGAVAWFGRTSLWGNIVAGGRAAADTPLRFPGQYWDAETGLHYNFFRYYDPTTGRYASPDPVGFLPNANRHGYVANPHTLADPLGLMPGNCAPTTTAAASGAGGGGKKPNGNGKKPSVMGGRIGKSKPAKPKLTINTLHLPKQDASGKPIEAQSPGGTVYNQYSPTGAYAGKNNRNAAGYRNPDHSHTNMLPLWEKAATSPIPPDVNKKNWLMDPNRHFQTYSPGGTNTGIIQGHSQGVLGHKPSASDHWNNTGMGQTRADNLDHNKQTGTYHGIENRANSDASGAGEPRYNEPRPDNGANRTYWDQNQPGFQGGPWPSWRPAAQQPGSSNPVPAPSSTPPSNPGGGDSDVDMPDA